MQKSTSPNRGTAPSISEDDIFDENQLRSLRHGTQDQHSSSTSQPKTITPNMSDLDIKIWSESNPELDSRCFYISNDNKGPHLL